jgi:hypothetical protein
MKKLGAIILTAAMVLSIVGAGVSSGATRGMGDVDGDGSVTISDALEILKFFAGMDNVITRGGVGSPAWNSAVITGGEKPTIGDALEVLKKLAGMVNLIDNPTGQGNTDAQTRADLMRRYESVKHFLFGAEEHLDLSDLNNSQLLELVVMLEAIARDMGGIATVCWCGRPNDPNREHNSNPMMGDCPFIEQPVTTEPTRDRDVPQVTYEWVETGETNRYTIRMVVVTENGLTGYSAWDSHNRLINRGSVWVEGSRSNREDTRYVIEHTFQGNGTYTFRFESLFGGITTIEVVIDDMVLPENLPTPVLTYSIEFEESAFAGGGEALIGATALIRVESDIPANFSHNGRSAMNTRAFAFEVTGNGTHSVFAKNADERAIGGVTIEIEVTQYGDETWFEWYNRQQREENPWGFCSVCGVGLEFCVC